MMVEVLKPVNAGDGPLEVGAVVDATEWRLARQLITQRYIRPVLAPVAPKSTRTGKERRDG